MFSTIFLILIAGILFRYLWKWLKLVKSLPPGPLAIPFGGNLLQFDRKDPRATLHKWHRKYGPIFTVWMGMEPYVFISDKDLMVEAFVKRSDEFSGRPYIWTYDFFLKGQYGITDNILDEEWKEQKLFTMNVMKQFSSGKNVTEKKIQQETKKFLHRLEQKLGSSSSKLAVINLKSDLDLCVGNILSSILLGRTFESDDPTFRQLVDNIEEITKVYSTAQIHLLRICFLFRFVPILNHFGFDDMMRVNDTFLDIMIQELRSHQERIKDDPQSEPTDLATIYLEELKRKKVSKVENSFQEWQIVAIMSDFWQSGLQATVATLQWGLLLLIEHPEHQLKIQKDIDAVIGRDRIAECADMTKMPYTISVINEIQRYANIFPINVPHTVSSDVVLAGYSIPKDTVVIPHISAVHMDEKIYPDPQKFQPERFLENDGKTLKTTDFLLPFSLGKRKCVGDDLARKIVFLVFVSLFQKFSLSINENEPESNLKPIAGFVYKPEPFKVCVQSRNS